MQALELVVDGVAHPVIAHGMPRLDFFADLHPGLDPFATDGIELDPGSAADPQLRAYRSGFWGLAPVPESDATRPIELSLRARLGDGRTATAAVASIERVGPIAAPLADPRPADDPDRGHGELVAICMATYNPPPDLFGAQIASIREQTHRNWICVISDDRSSDAGLQTIRARGRRRSAVRRFGRSPRRLGFYNNFERALALAPRAAPFVAMADQDDRWHPDKLARCWARSATPSSSTATARGRRGRRRCWPDTYWSTRRNNHSDLLSLLVANAVTGAASLLRRDCWTTRCPSRRRSSLTSTITGSRWSRSPGARSGSCDRPLYDYVQHGDASLGHAAANQHDVAASAAAPTSAIRTSACGCGGCTTSSTSRRLLHGGDNPAAALRRRA